ncbi:MAG: 23S rRNA (adenine(2503)-C(2))-methyltransferase RlmN [bacterium]|nr:23S rRNA (adenine(2503)-C(2))-methyltransferase RlmN [bacterium]
MNFQKIEKILEKEPSFRIKQVKKAIFQDLIGDWNEITTLPQNLRQKLSKKFPIEELKAEKILTSKDNQTIKVLFELKDGFKIESVLMRHKDDRITVCVSSQVGCAMNCQFCATGQQGFKRNLSSSEIVEQILFFARLLKKDKEKITNVVFMGMGEPLLNYANILEAIKILNNKDGFNLGSRHISISTCGVTEGIKKLSEEKLQVNLAISLHAPNNNLRERLMPINKKYPIEKILAAVDDYIKKTKRRVMFEYLMIDGVNDSPIQAKELAGLLKKRLYFVNLISFNPIGHSEFKPSSGWKIKQFKETLEKAGITVTQRYRFGKEIKAACGQLAGGQQR